MTLIEVIALTFAYYNQGKSLSDALLRMYASDLSDLDEQSCLNAYHLWRRNPVNKTFPLPAQIRELVNPTLLDIDEAREAASKICAAVTKYGYVGAKSAREYIGDLGWRVVDRHGGWVAVCENMTSHNLPILQAQFRELALTQKKYMHIENIERLKLSGTERGLEPIGDVVKRLIESPR